MHGADGAVWLIIWRVVQTAVTCPAQCPGQIYLSSFSPVIDLGRHVAAEEDAIAAAIASCWVLGTMRVMMFSTAISQAKPMMTANTADLTNRPITSPSTL